MKNAVVLWGVFLALFSGGCNLHEKPVGVDLPEAFTRDIGPQIHEFGRPAHWQVERVYLGDTGFAANVGPCRYQDESNTIPDYYTIDVEFRTDHDSWDVYFERHLPMDSIPPGLLSERADEIVTFDAATRTVTFTVGDRVYTYRLPKRQPSH